jgi:lipopolysaccharide biosynthesis glycosyltransferase
MIGVTIGVGERFEGLARLAAASVEKHTGLSTRVLTEAQDDPCFLKLKMFDLVDEDDIFYFDADTRMLRPWCVTDCAGQEEFLAVADLPSFFVKLECHQCGLPDEGYFNTGMMILNRRHHQRVMAEAEAIFQAEPFRTFYHEQTYINLACHRLGAGVRLLPEAYNYIGYGTIRGAPADVVLAHSAGGVGYDKGGFLRAVGDWPVRDVPK